MADKFIPPTSGGQPAGVIQSTLGTLDPHYKELRTRSAPQEAAQLFGLGQTMKRLSTGFQAPDINAERAAEYRNLRENVLPQIAQHYGAGLGGRGAFEQNVASAQTGVQERLAALQNQRKFELQKLQQEQLPRLMELGLAPSFQGHITEGPFNPKAAPEKTVANKFMESEAVQRALGTPGNIAAALAEKQRTPQEVAAARQVQKGAGAYERAKVKAKDIPATVLDKLRPIYQAVEKATRPSAAGAPGVEPGKAPTAKEQAQFEVKQLGTKLGLPDNVIQYLAPEHMQMLEYLASRTRGTADLARIDSVDDIAKLYNFWQKNPAKREKIGDFFRQLVGKKPKQRG